MLKSVYRKRLLLRRRKIIVRVLRPSTNEIAFSAEGMQFGGGFVSSESSAERSTTTTTTYAKSVRIKFNISV